MVKKSEPGVSRSERISDVGLDRLEKQLESGVNISSAVLVLLQGDIDGFRVTEPCQCKAQLADNGRTLVKSCNAAMARLGGSRRAR